MSNDTAINFRVLLGVIFAVLATVSGIASCSSGGGKHSAPTPPSTTTVSAYATPALLASSGGSSVITWSSTNSDSCSSSPNDMIGNGKSGSFTTAFLSATTTYTITCVGPTGSASQLVTITVAVATVPVLSGIINAANACAALPTQGTVYYYCDCGLGAAAGCVAGIDTNAGTSPTAPRRTVANAIGQLNSSSPSNKTIALCQGGAFNATAGFSITNSTCAPGSTCNDLREYAPPASVSTAKPIINNAPGGVALFTISNSGGVRLLNLALKGDNGAYGNSNYGVFLYKNAHDVTMCNLDMSQFDIAVYNESNAGVTNNVKLTGSTITNSRKMGYLGSGNNNEVSHNLWNGNGSSSSLDHTLYFEYAGAPAGADTPVTNIQVVGNYIQGQYGPTCLGAPVVSHAEIIGFNVSGNTVILDPAQTTGGCWGMGFNNSTSSTHPMYFRNAVFSGNTIINGGNNSLSIASCPGCIIENNVIIQNWPAGGAIGINVVENASRTVNSSGQTVSPPDDVSNANIVRHNTIWFGPNATGTNTGINVYHEGTGHIVTNNTVSSTQTSGSLNCFNYPLVLSSYAFINNNHCYSSPMSNNWETTRGTFAAWKSYSGWDAASITGDPLFTTPGTDFTPVVGPPASPLIGAGTAASASYGTTTGADTNGTLWAPSPAIGAYE